MIYRHPLQRPALEVASAQQVADAALQAMTSRLGIPLHLVGVSGESNYTAAASYLRMVLPQGDFPIHSPSLRSIGRD